MYIPRSSMLEATETVGRVVLHWQQLAAMNILVEMMVSFSNKTMFFEAIRNNIPYIRNFNFLLGRIIEISSLINPMDIKEDKYTKQWFFFGMKIYQDDYDYKNETTNQKTEFK